MSSSSVTPPPSVPLPAAPASGTPLLVSVPEAPAVLILLPRGTPVEARVVAAPEGGQPAQIQLTVEGETLTLPARLPLSLPTGAALSLRALPVPGGDAVLRLAAVDGRPPALAADPAARVDGAPASAAPVAAQPATTVGVGRPVGATVLRGDVIPDAPQGEGLLVPGTRLSLRVTQLTMPAPGSRDAAPATPPAPSSAVPAAPPPQGAAAYAAVTRIAQPAPPFAPPAAPAAPAAAAAAPAVRGPFVPFAPHGLTPPGVPAPALPGAPPAPGAPVPSPGSPAPSPEAPAPDTLAGTVVGRTALGQPTLRTPAGFVALDLRASLPVGTRVAAEVLARIPPEAGAPPPAAFAGASPTTTLETLVRTLAAADPASAARVAAQVPQPGPQLLANLAAAMVAVRSGDAAAWLRLADLPARARDDARVGRLAQRLAEDLHEASAATQRPAAEWRVYPLPMFAGGQVERIQMLVRRTPGADDDETARRGRGGDDTRFLLDFTLSNLGAMQIDGLVSRAARSLDLVVRTHGALPEPMPREIQGIFAEAMTGIGYAGTLSFRVTPAFVVPEAPRPGDDRAGLVV